MAVEVPPLPPIELAARVSAADADVIGLYEEGRASRAEIGARLPEDWSFAGKRVLDFGCGVGRTLRHFLDEARTGEFYGCDIDPEPGGSAATAGRRFVRPDLSNLGLHTYRGPVVGVAARAASPPSRRRTLHRDDPRPRTLRGVGQGAAGRPDRASHGTAGGGPGRDERAPLRQVLGPRRAGGFHLRLVAARALGTRIRRPLGRGGRVRLRASWRGQGVAVLRKRPVEITVEEIERVDAADGREMDALRHNIRQLHHESQKAREAAAWLESQR